MKTSALTLCLLLPSIALAQSAGSHCRAGSMCQLQSLELIDPSVRLNQRPMGFLPLPNGTMKCGYCFMAASNATTLGCAVIGSGIVNGTPGAQPALTGATRQYVEWVSAGTTNSVAGYTPLGANFRAHTKPVVGGVFRWEGESSLVFWLGEFESTPIAIVPATGPTVSGIDFAAIGYQSSVSAQFRICSGDGTNYSCADMTGAAATPTAAHEYAWFVDPRTETGVANSVYLWDLTAGTTGVGRKTNNLLRSVNTLGVNITGLVVTTENVAKKMQMSDVFMCMN